jgi:hypothetical protein
MPLRAFPSPWSQPLSGLLFVLPFSCSIPLGTLTQPSAGRRFRDSPRRESSQISHFRPPFPFPSFSRANLALSSQLFNPPLPKEFYSNPFSRGPQCDIIYASTTSTFGLPEIKIGTIPGAGGTQRLARALGKHKAMELILTGDTISGAELAHYGVVNKALPADQVVAEAMSLAARIARMSGCVANLGKRAVLMGNLLA